MFNADQQTVKAPEFRENFLPALVLCGAVASSVLLPSFKSYCLPMIKAQGKQQKSLVFKLVNFQKSLTKNLTLKIRECQLTYQRDHILTMKLQRLP